MRTTTRKQKKPAVHLRSESPLHKKMGCSSLVHAHARNGSFPVPSLLSEEEDAVLRYTRTPSIHSLHGHRRVLVTLTRKRSMQMKSAGHPHTSRDTNDSWRTLTTVSGRAGHEVRPSCLPRHGQTSARPFFTPPPPQQERQASALASYRCSIERAYR